MTPLYGHDAAVAAFRAGLEAGRLHHAWLVTGPKGVGKALFADKAALRVLAHGAGSPVEAPGLDVPDEHPAARLAAAGSHPDLMRLERLTRDTGTDLARNITVDQVRGLALAEAIALWERASDLASAARRHSLDPQAVVFELAGMLAALAVRKDKAA